MPASLLRYAVLALLALPLVAQPAITLATSPLYPGASVIVTATLSGSASMNIAGIGAALPINAVAPTAGPASTAAGKTLWSAGVNLLLVGVSNGSPPTINVTPYADGAILSFTYVVPTSAPVGSLVNLGLTNVIVANASGTQVPVTANPLSAPVGMNPACVNALEGNLTIYLATPSFAALNTIITELVAAASTGTCH